MTEEQSKRQHGPWSRFGDTGGVHRPATLSNHPVPASFSRNPDTSNGEFCYVTPAGIQIPAEAQRPWSNQLKRGHPADAPPISSRGSSGRLQMVRYFTERDKRTPSIPTRLLRL
jgi:hypothetical protein